jgi:glycosyltransferase involved in cell wall biosynthesis
MTVERTPVSITHPAPECATTSGHDVSGSISAAPRRLYYLCFQVTREGQASHAHVNEILGGLQDRGWQVALFQPKRGGSKTSLLRKLGDSLAPQAKLWKTRPRPHILYCRLHPAALPSLIWARLHGIPVISEVNGTSSDLRLVYPHLFLLGPLVTAASTICLALASRAITVTAALAGWLQQRTPWTRVEVVPNAANERLFRPDAIAPRPVDEPYVVFVGAMSPWQGIDTLIEAASLPAWPDAVKLVFVGDGVERQRVEDAAVANPRIVYVGRKPYADIPGILAQSLAGLSTQNRRRGRSSAYGFSAMKVYETMSCGRPAIVTDFPGQGDLVRGENAGIVLEPEDAAGVARAVAFLHANPDAASQMGHNGRAAVEQRHTWAHRAATTEVILRSALQGRRTHA